MGNLVGMAKAIQRVLMEEELKDISSKVRNGDVIKIILAHGGQYIFEIEGGVGGNFIIKDVNDGKRYTFSNEDFKNDILTVYPYTGGIEKVGGIEHKISHMSIDIAGEIYDIEPIMMGDIEPEPEAEVEPESPAPEAEVEVDSEDVITPEKKVELAQSKGDFNTRIKQSKKDDILFINTGIETDDGMFDEHAELEFVVFNVNEDYVQMALDGASGSKSAFYFNNLNNKQIFINKGHLINIVDGSLQLEVVFDDKGASKSIIIENIISVSNNVKNPINEPHKIVRGISQQSLINDIGDEYADDIWSKQPNLLKAIQGASPTGMYQIKQILDKSKVDSAYLSDGSKVRFRIIGGKEIVGTNNTITLRLNPKEDKGYSGTIIKDKTIKSGGAISRTHWEIELLDEVETNKYKSRISFCTKENSCISKGLVFVEIMKIQNKKNNI